MKGVSVIRNDSVSGVVIGEEAGNLVVEFNDGTRAHVLPTELVPQSSGIYRLATQTASTPSSQAATAESEEMVIPVVAEEIAVETQRVARGKVRVNKRIETREEVVSVPIVHEEVIVEHVPINKFVDDVVPEMREEDGVLIIPLIEETVVVEKRLLVREEVRVYKRQTTENIPQTVVLRREVVDIERIEFDDAESLENRELNNV
jgi:uncharacterized protein (TIGR02271 family)